MKTRHHLWAALLLIVTLLAACKDENPFNDNFVPRHPSDLPEKLQPGHKEESYLTVSPTTLSFGSSASSQTATVTTNITTAYTITASNSTWLTASASSDRKTLTVSVTQNSGSSSRSGSITLASAGLTATVSVTQAAGSTPVVSGDPEAVDLGLPSGTKWANMNVGASSPEDYGLFFAWGETVGYGSDTSDGHSFSWSSYKYCNGSSSTMTKYCTDSSYGTVDNKSTLELSDDAAYVNWGSSWRMPTYDEVQELLNNTTSDWTTLNGVYGRRFTSKTNGNSIFLPAAGYRYDSSLDAQGSGGYYWSSSLDPSYSFLARYLFFHSGDAFAYAYGRFFGQSVRPVHRN